MNNVLLIVLVTVIVLVNCYFTYRRSDDLDEKGRKILAALQLIYLAFIIAVFALGYIGNKLGLTRGAQLASQKSWLPFIIVTVSLILIFVVVLIFKAKLERKVREEHTIR